MFGFGKPALPISEDDRLWIDAAFIRFGACLGEQRMREVGVLVPSDESFPDAYNGSMESIAAMARRIASHIGVAPETFTVELFQQGHLELHKDVPFLGERKWQGAAGLYTGVRDDGRFAVHVNADKRQDPLAVAAILAHELAHVVLLGGDLIPQDDPDMEPLTDLCTVYLGCGILGASTSFRFQKFTRLYTEGWSMNRVGYLPEQVWGYALAKFAMERGEQKPTWASFLEGAVADYFRKSMRWLMWHRKTLAENLQ